jgi:hypothetical protein
MRQITLMIFAAVLFTATLVLGQGVPEIEKGYVNTKLYPATALLYSQTAEGSMDMRCTATAVEETDSTFTFVTASHCGCSEDSVKNIVTVEKTFFFISPDIPGNKIYLKATPIGCGFRHRGDDFFLLTTDKTIHFPIIPLGKDPKRMDSIINVGGPLGLGKQIFVGMVTNPSVDRPIVDGDINWTNAVLLQLFGVNGGSSGSSVVCEDQHAICSFVVGSVAETTMVAMPVSRLIKFREDLAAGKYKWYVANPDEPAKIVVGAAAAPPKTD